MELKLNVWTVSLTVILALLASCFVYTEFHFTQTIDIPTTAENTFKFISNPMVSRDLHPLATEVRILSTGVREEGEPQHIKYTISERLPLLGVHTFTVDMYTDPDRLVMYSLCTPLNGLLSLNVTWTVQTDASNPDHCTLAEHSRVNQPWMLQYYVQLQMEETHRQLFTKIKHAITKIQSGGFRMTTEKPPYKNKNTLTQEF